MTTEFAYTTYIKTTPDKVWQAITTPEFCRQYWGHNNVSDWQVGSPWQHSSPDGNSIKIKGTILESSPPHRLVMSWGFTHKDEAPSKVAFTISAIEDMVRLDVVHTQLTADSAEGVSVGWPLVLASMKSFLEHGKPLNVAAVYNKSCADSAANAA